MVIDGTFNAASEGVSLFDSGVDNDDAPLGYNNDYPMDDGHRHDGHEPSSKRLRINPPKDRIRNLSSSNTPHQEAEKRRCVTTNAPCNPYITNNTNETINPSVSVTPAATATFAAATSLQGSVYNLFGIDTNDFLNDDALPTFPPCEDDDYEDYNDADKDAVDAMPF